MIKALLRLVKSGSKSSTYGRASYMGHDGGDVEGGGGLAERFASAGGVYTLFLLLHHEVKGGNTLGSQCLLSLKNINYVPINPMCFTCHVFNSVRQISLYLSTFHITPILSLI